LELILVFASLISGGKGLNFLNINIKKIVVIVALLSLPLISINTQQSPLNTSWYDRPFYFLASFVQQSFFSFSVGVKDTVSTYLNLLNIKREIEDLKQQNQALLTKMSQFSELENELNRMAKLLDFKERSKMEMVAARIMSRDIISEHKTIQINKGTAHGLQKGMAVITTEGVVGHIFRPQNNTSHVLLIGDRYSVIDGVDQRSRARGLVEGKSSDNLVLRHVDKSEDVKEGDLIVTSGLDNIFPKGFPIAVISKVENKAYTVSLRVELKPVVEPNKLEEVFIILNAKEQDLTSILSMSQ
jgi:rod shape-determining protein MreC